MPTIRSVYRDGENWLTLYRLTDDAGMAYAPGSISAVDVKVTDESNDPATDIYLLANPAVGTVFFSSFQTDYGWDQDDIGYNFRHIIPPRAATPATAAAPLSVAGEGGHVYKIDYSVTTNTDGVRHIVNFVTVFGGLD